MTVIHSRWVLALAAGLYMAAGAEQASAIKTRPMANCSCAQARSPASIARRHRIEQNRWGLPPVDRRPKALPHHGHVLVLTPTPRLFPQHRNILCFSMS